MTTDIRQQLAREGHDARQPGVSKLARQVIYGSLAARAAKKATLGPARADWHSGARARVLEPK